MKIYFFLFALGFTLLMVTMVSVRGWQALQPLGTARIWYVAANIILFLTMLVGLMSRGALPPAIGKVVTFIGFTYMIVMIYLLLSFLLVDIIRLANYFFHFAPAGMKVFRLWAFAGTLGVVTIAMIIGNYKFNHPAIVNLHIKTEKSDQNKSLKIVAASDIHLGPSIDKELLKKYVSLINDQKPDIVLLAGDIADNSTKPLIDQKMAEELRNIKTTLGVYAITGNHEYYGENPYSTEAYLKSAGITYLRDSSVLVNNSFYIVGRDDKTNANRESLKDVMRSVDTTKPVILLDHQPFHLNEAQENDVDLQISGHTHNGQFFPGNLIVKLMYELAYGYMQKGKTHYYVSSGLGLWGPQYRIGTQSELVVIDMKY